MSRLTWFEIHAAEPARAMRFYEARGWTVEGHGTGPDGPYALLRKDEAPHREGR